MERIQNQIQGKAKQNNNGYHCAQRWWNIRKWTNIKVKKGNQEKIKRKSRWVMIYVPFLQSAECKGELFLLAKCFFLEFYKEPTKVLWSYSYSFSHSISDDFEQWKNQQRKNISFHFVHLERATDRKWKKGSKNLQLAGYFLWLQRWKSNTVVNSNIFFYLLKHFFLSNPNGKIVSLESRQFHATIFYDVLRISLNSFAISVWTTNRKFVLQLKVVNVCSLFIAFMPSEWEIPIINGMWANNFGCKIVNWREKIKNKKKNRKK